MGNDKDTPRTIKEWDTGESRYRLVYTGVEYQLQSKRSLAESWGVIDQGKAFTILARLIKEH